MKQSKLSPWALVLSAVLIVAGLLAFLLGQAPVYAGGSAAMVSHPQMFLSMLAVVVLSFVYGMVRYSLAGAVTLAAVSLHDQLLAFALAALVSLVLPQVSLLPVMVILAAVFTYAFSLPLLREARELRGGGSTRQLSHQQAAGLALSNTRGLRMASALLALLLFVAAAIGGGLRLAKWTAPVLLGILAACWGAEQVAPWAWAAAIERRQQGRGKR